MSGGHYNYNCFQICQFADMVAADIVARGEDQEIMISYDYTEKRPALPKDLLAKMQLLVDVLNQCGKAARDLEWCMSGDTCEETAVKSIDAAMVEVGKIVETHYSGSR